MTATIEYNALLAHYALLHGEEEAAPLAAFMNILEEMGGSASEWELWDALAEPFDLETVIDIRQMGCDLMGMGLVDMFWREGTSYYKIKKL